MIKSNQLNNIILIINFLLREIFKSIVNNNFFKSKINRAIFFTLGILAYIGYIYINISQFYIFNSSDDIRLAKQLVSSFVNVTIITSGLIYLFIDITFNLSSRSLFLLKCLPFSLKEISIAKVTFKLFLSMLIYEVIIIVALPLFTLTHMSVIQFVEIFIIIHLIMVDCFLVLEIIVHRLLMKYIPNILGYTIYTCSIISFCVLYFVHLRFKIDIWVYHSSYHINFMLFILLIASIIMLFGSIVTLYLSSESDTSYKMKNYLNIRLSIDRTVFNVIFLAIIRQKKLVYIFFLTILASVLGLIYFGWTQSLQIFYFLYPSMLVVGIFYASSTYKVRKFFNLYRISIMKEFMYLVISQIVLVLPMALLPMIVDLPMNYIYIGFMVITLTIISGFIFPAFESSINESTSSLLTFFIVIMISFLLSKPQYLFLVFLMILGTEFVCIYRERKEIFNENS